MRIVTKFAFLAIAAAISGCNLLDTTAIDSGSSCPSSNVIAAGAGINDFRQRIPRQTAIAPPDSVLDVVLIFLSAYTQADQDRITTSAGMNVSTAGTTSALKAEFKANDLAAYVASDNGRLQDAVIYIPQCANF